MHLLFLEIKTSSFTEKYLQYDKDIGYFLEVLTESPCIFLSSNNKCFIEKAKPTQCRTYPYWREYLNKKGNLVKSKFKRPCPGVN